MYSLLWMTHVIFILGFMIHRTPTKSVDGKMPYRMSQQMNKCEASLLEHMDAVVKLLNDFTLKDISSQRVILRLEYLYDKLNDFLVKKICADHKKIYSDPRQQAIGNLPITTDKEFETRTPSKMALEDVQYVCGLCRSPITIYNSDHKLSMDLHYQEDKHQQALTFQKMRGVEAVIPETGKRTHQLKKVKGVQAKTPKTGKSTEQLKEMNKVQAKIQIVGKSTEQLQKLKGAQATIPKTRMSIEQFQEMKGVQAAIKKTDKSTEINYKYISQTAEKKYQCCLCNVYVHSQKCVHEHVRGTMHQKKLVALQTEYSKDGIVTTDTGVMYCQVCGVSVGSSSIDAIQHKLGKVHLQKLLSKQLKPSKEDKFWSKIPEGLRSHRRHFVNLGDIVVQCGACSVSVPKTTINVLSHIRGKKHSHVLSDNI